MPTSADLNLPQLQASNPKISVWTMASAGTGKTKVLIDRLMKLLIEGANPQKILCLTFTKAAANEIKSRINKETAKWSTCKDEELRSLLKQLFGFHPKEQLLIKAKNLLNELSKAPEPIKICTIHAFCQHVLKKFPIEAGISPTFRVVDELLMHQVIERLKKELFCEKSCTNAIKFFAANFHETTLDEILHDVISGKFLALTDIFTSPEEYKVHLSKKTSISIEDKEAIISSYLLNIPIISQIFLKSDHVKDAIIINSINTYLSLSKEQKIRRWRDLNPIFLTTNQSKRVSILSKKTKDHNPELAQLLDQWQNAFQQLIKKIANYTALHASSYLYEIASVLLKKYQIFKLKNEYLDYEDLIFFTNKLLSQSAEKEWVLYKLDGGIDHILIDEAQDTSKAQWQVIQNLISDFFSGDSRQNDRTVFVVGDEKQSIYSFQGADVQALQDTRQIIKNGMKNAKKNHQSIELTNCYRSTQLIVNFIQKALKESRANFNVPNIQSMRSTVLGRVELWPMLNLTTQKKVEFWPSPIQNHKIESAKFQISKIIALYIKDLLSKRIILPSTNAPIKESDITILVQRRNAFTNILIDNLRNQGLSVCGLDRIKLQSNLSILDIIAIAKFALLPSDNLNCAIVLKSPLFKLKEHELYEIASEGVVWHNLCSNTRQLYQEIFLKLQEILKLSVNYSIFDFFLLLLDCLGLRKLLLQNNCKSDDQVIDEFLQIVKKFENEIRGNLYDFVDWFENNELEVKREQTNEEGIKIMTVHAAKGLESSVVIIPDANCLKIDDRRICWIEDDCVLFLPREKSDLIDQYKALDQEKSYQEYLRLLYVALSRCKDYLITCSNTSSKEAHQDSWYSIASKAIKKLGTTQKSELLEKLGLKEDPWVIQSEDFKFANKPTRYLETKQHKFEIERKWSQRPCCYQNFTHSLSPLKEENKSALRGSIIHKLLEESANGAPIHTILTHPLLFKFSAKEREQTILKLQNLFNIEFWQSLFKDKIYTEVSFFDHKDAKSLIGRIDLLTINDSEIRIVDYKTDVLVPKSNEQIPLKYIEQMNKYKTAISKIYPNHKVSCYILWLSGEIAVYRLSKLTNF